LMELLLDRGAMIERIPGEAVRACLANGRPLAARFLAARGAVLDFENASGIGDFDRVKELLASTSKEAIARAFVWACGYGYSDIVRFLLDFGVDPAASVGAGMTGLHLAAHEGHLDIIKLLLAHNAPLEVKNSYGGTVLDQTLWSAVNHPRAAHKEIVETLIAAGAKVEDDWFTGIPEIDALLHPNADPIDQLMQRGRRVRFSQPEEARTLFAEAAKKSRERGARRELVDALKGIAQIDRDLGRRADALPFYEEAVAVCRELGDPLLLAHTLRHLGDLHHDAGRDDLAEPLYEEALALYRVSDTPPLDLANALRSLAVIKNTAELWEEVFHLYVTTNVAPGVVETALRLAKLADRNRAREWIRVANEAAEAANDDALRQRVRVAREEIS
jgi:tetratricopeptide (TPR) repeat protein